MKNFTKQLLLLTSATALSGLGYAATDGTLGSTSSGSVNLNGTATVPAPAQIIITGLEDFDWGSVQIDNSNVFDFPPISINNVCVYMGSPSGNYSVSINSTNGGNVFLLSNSTSTESVPYVATYTDGLNNSHTFLDSPNLSTSMTASTSSSCVGTNDLSSLSIDPGIGQFFVRPTESVNFFDTLIITVIPE